MPSPAQRKRKLIRERLLLKRGLVKKEVKASIEVTKPITDSRKTAAIRAIEQLEQGTIEELLYSSSITVLASKWQVSEDTISLWRRKFKPSANVTT